MAERTSHKTNSVSNPKSKKSSSKDGSKKKEYTVGGYTFNSKDEAQAAKDELNAIKYVSSKTDGSDPKQVFILYNKIIDRKLFTTAIGINYLKNLQQFLYNCDDIPRDKIQPIPISIDTQAEMERRHEQIAHRSELRDLSIQAARYKNNFIKAMILNVALIIVIIAMLLILKTSSNANIINYEVNIQDKYAIWQEQLESQEASLKAREAELQNK
ncbi:MAG: hypothetical protein Q4F06_04935 [Eubacteriales bacterium]|nr:hypothetical protein [Eubacteriales bacterium]